MQSIGVCKDHPRVSGEHFILAHFADSNDGSSPRERGARSLVWEQLYDNGIIPA